MIVIDHPAVMRAWSRAHAAAGRRVALVPTMGALHDGHAALIRAAQHHADVVVVSIFVNPLQFDRRDDFDRYPRPLDDDLAECRRHGVDAVFSPPAAAMYPPGFDTHIEPGRIAELFEGVHRPGHFRGVATVVAKLLLSTEAHAAVFGEKDAQQLAVIRRMVDDLDIGVEIIGLETVREADGVALSSRNRRLSDDDRRAARCVPAALGAAVAAWLDGEREPSAVAAAGHRVVAAEPRARLEHLEVVDEAFAPFPGLLPLPDEAGSGARVVTAVWFGDVRLIDNVPLRAD